MHYITAFYSDTQQNFRNLFIKHFENIKNSLIFASIKRTFKKHLQNAIISIYISTH